MKYEDIKIKEYTSLPQLRFGVQHYVNFYNTRRVHSALCYQTPDEYNVFGELEWDDFDVNTGLIAALNANRAFLDDIVRGAQRHSPQGIFDGVGANIYLGHRGHDGKWLTLGGADDPSFLGSELQKIGLPAAYSEAGARVWAVTGQTVDSMSETAIETMLARGAYLDGFAVEALHRRGYGALTGFSIREIIREDAIEEYVDHPLNREVRGRRRNARQSFWYQPAFALNPAPGAEVLSRCVDYAGIELAGCLSGVYVNERGGRIAVNGYYPWSTMFYRCKTMQMKRLFRWLSQDTLDGYLVGYHRAALWCRGGNRTIVWNMSQDPLTEGELMLRTDDPVRRLRRVDGSGGEIHADKTDGAYRRFRLPAFGAWEVLYLERG